MANQFTRISKADRERLTDEGNQLVDNVPFIRALAQALTANKQWVEKGEWNDVRLNVQTSGWTLLTGDSSYDQDHRGCWGASSLSRSTNCQDLASELIDQVMEEIFQSHTK